MNTLDGSLSMLRNPAIIKFILQGVLFTLIISVAAVLFSIVIGTVLALMRNYCTGKQTGVLKALSVIYIEVFRNTPLLFWIFICVVFCPAPGFVDRQMFGLSSVNNKLLFKAAVALILYTSGVIAEIVRGGLNSVSHGQIEAGQSQGFSMLQIMWYIVLPQTFRAIVPTLLSQVITTIKDSSFLANVAVIELMARTKQVLSAANRYNGLNSINVSDVFVLFGLAATIYFVINFSISMTVRNLQKRKMTVKVKKLRHWRREGRQGGRTMDKYVITISRQFGAMGRTIAQKMAAELGIEFYDRDIVEHTAKRMGLPVSEISKEEERAGGFFAERRYPLGMGPVSMQEELFQVQTNIIRDFASKESCIIVGRCGDYCLRDMERVLDIYVYAPIEKRVENSISILGMDEKTARGMIQDVDKARENYRRKYCKDIAGIFDNRDICIDSGKFGADTSADILCGVVRSVFD